MAWTKPATTLTGDAVTAGGLNRVADNLRWLHSPPALRLRMTSGWIVTQNQWTRIVWQERLWGDGRNWELGPIPPDSGFTADPTIIDRGLWRIDVTTIWETTAASLRRAMRLRVDPPVWGADTWDLSNRPAVSGSNRPIHHAVTTIRVGAPTAVRLEVLHTGFVASQLLGSDDVPPGSSMTMRRVA